MIITYIHSNRPEDQFRVQLRCRNFVDAINRIGWHSANLMDLRSFVNNTPEAQQLCAVSDLLIVHRYLYGPVLRAIEYWKAHDKKVIVDFDQAIDHLTSDIPCSSFWLEKASQGQRNYWTPEDSTPLEQFKLGLSLIDAAIVSSTRLMIDWSPFTDVYEVPDYLNTDQYPAFKQEHAKETWIGLSNAARLTSVKNSGLLEALETVCRNRPQVRLIISDLESETGEFLNIPPSQQIRYRSHSFEDWADILLRLDIGLAPGYGEYDLRLGRANLLEFMVSKTPWVASDQPCFRELSRYGRLVPNTPDSWLAVILKIVDNLDIVQKRAAGEPFLFALSQDVNQNIDKVMRLYLHILNQNQSQRLGVR